MEVKIVRSDKRTQSLGARIVDGVIVVRVPAHLSEEELQPLVRRLVERVERKQEGRALDDAALERRARELNREYFGGKLQWQSIGWVTNQAQRFGSCTPSQGTIRISHRVAKMPRFVLDYLLVHELAHLIHPHHNARFWKAVHHYPLAERARGYLMAAGLEAVEE